VNEEQWLAERFEEHRPRLRSVAYRMLGSLAEADDAVQDAWLRLSGRQADEIDNLGGWLTTVVARECLHMLRSRRRRREDLVGDRLPDPVITAQGEILDPEHEALLADSVSLALLVVLDALTPAERLAFVLHDMFDLPFDEIAGVIDRSPAAARQLASRARRRVQGAPVPQPDDLAKQRKVVDAFYAAADKGDFDGLVKVLAPDVVLRADFGPNQPTRVYRGVAEVAKYARRPRGAKLHPALINGQVGSVVTINDKPSSIMAFTVVDGKIVEIDGIRGADRVWYLANAVLAGTA
jgi:RNA polymerase sigma-70 factor (ECF subfamily)